MPGPAVHVDEIEHVSGGHPVDQVSGGAAHDQRQSGPGQLLRRFERRCIERESDQRGQRHDGQQDGLVGEIRLIEKAVRGAGVVDPGQVEPVRNRP